MSKILSTSTISQELMIKASAFMMEPSHTVEEQHELLEKLTYVQHIIDEIAEQINTCTCEDCTAWTNILVKMKHLALMVAILGGVKSEK